MLTGSDQIQILSLDFVHHRIHLCKGHNTGYHIAANHKRRNTVGKAPVNHKVTGIGDYGGMQSCNIAHEIIEAISGYLSCSIQINAVKGFHNIGVIRNLKIRNQRLAELFDLYVLAVIFSNGYTGIDDIGNGHHNL